MIKRNLLLAAAIAVLPGLAFSQVSKSGSGYLLRLKFKAGTTQKYTVTTHVSGLPSNAPGSENGVLILEGPLVQAVKSVAGAVATITANVGPFTLKGTETEASSAQSATFQMDALGNIVGAQKQGGGFGVHFPKEIVKIDGTWTAVAALPGTMGGTGSAKTTYRFKGIKTVNKKKLADITLAMTPFSLVKSGSGEVFVSPVDGSLVSMTLNLTLSNPQGGPDMKVTTSIVPAK